MPRKLSLSNPPPDQGRRARNLALLVALLAAVALFYVVAVVRMGQD